jgi:hypothetical protein
MYKSISFFAGVLFSMSCNDNRPRRELIVAPTQVSVVVDSLVKNTHTVPKDDTSKISDADRAKMDKYFGK